MSIGVYNVLYEVADPGIDRRGGGAPICLPKFIQTTAGTASLIFSLEESGACPWEIALKDEF